MSRYNRGTRDDKGDIKVVEMDHSAPAGASRPSCGSCENWSIAIHGIGGLYNVGHCSMLKVDHDRAPIARRLSACTTHSSVCQYFEHR